MKVLILSCNTGGGHNAAAQAIAEAIREHGDCAEVLDYLSLAGNGVSKLVGAAIILSCTESLFYTMSVYLMAAKVRKSRYIIPCALLSLGAGIVVSILLANMLVS